MKMTIPRRAAPLHLHQENCPLLLKRLCVFFKCAIHAVQSGQHSPQFLKDVHSAILSSKGDLSCVTTLVCCCHNAVTHVM